jgi:predicted N-acetyltransferase YhbS
VNSKSYIELRPEAEADYQTVEHLTREAFWNRYVPGCDEHLLARKLRTAKAFVRELDFVAIVDSKIVGSIMYTESKIIDDEDRAVTVLTFGPVSVLPEYQNKGVGSALIERTKSLAHSKGCPAILIYGDPEYYRRFGFAASKTWRITNHEGKYPAALLALELHPGALDGIMGKFEEADIYAVDKNELAEFEKGFPPKAKGAAKTQERFNELSRLFL